MIEVKAFCSYSQKDERWKRELLAALSPLQRMGLMETWHFRLIPAGREWEPEIDFHLHTAQVILLLVSSDFINSNYCFGIELATALERHDSGNARVVPVLLRDCLWEGLPFSHLQMLPGSAKSVRSWQNRDAAWTNVARGVKAAIDGVDPSGLWPRSETEKVNMHQGAPRNNFFDVAAAGDTSVSAEDEPEFALRSVRQCKYMMRTISYREEDWWSAQVGDDYLEEQRQLLERNGRIQRIFVIPGPHEEQSLQRLTETMDQQARIGVEVFYVYETDIPAGYFSWVQDFILYDDSFLRVSTTVPPNGLLGRPAEVHADPSMVARGLQWFNGLLALSTQWQAVE